MFIFTPFYVDEGTILFSLLMCGRFSVVYLIYDVALWRVPPYFNLLSCIFGIFPVFNECLCFLRAV